MTRRATALLAALTLTTAMLVSACAGDGGNDSDQPEPGPASSAANSPSGSASSPTAPAASPAGSASPSTSSSPSTSGSPSPAGSTGGASQAYWHPTPGTPWQWQLSGTVDQSVDVPVYDIDGFENDASVVASLHAKGRKVICYVNTGAWESFRPDAAAFPSSVRGSGDGWKGENWFDIRQIDVLRPLLAQRFQMCKDKGFDAIEPDLLDAYQNNSGFPLTADEQIAYNKMIAQLAHGLGLGVALKNDVDQVPQLVDSFDFAVDEQCAQYQECDELTPFIQQNKAVLHVEYTVPTSQFCAQSDRLRFSSMEKHLELDAWRQPC